MDRSIRVLHVDDDPDFLELAAIALERSDDRFEVETATSPSEGLDRLAAGQRADDRDDRRNEDCDIDCVVSDYDMPDMDGLEFLRAVREEYPKLPFILFTGKGSETVASEAIAAGVTDYLQKGSGIERYELLANRIENAFEQFDAVRRAEELDRVRRVIQDVNRVLVGAETREQLDQRVCEIIADAEPYRFAWIGEHDREARTVEARAAAGIEAGYLDSIEITTDESETGRGPTGRAVRTHELAVMQNIRENPDYEPWREAAIERGYRSSAAVPLVHEGSLYGVLNVYADRPSAFDRKEREFLCELGGNVAHAHHRVELQQQYERQYRELFENAPAMIAATHNTDGEPTIEACNRRFAERLGYDREQLRGRRLAELYTEESAKKLLEEGGYERALTGTFSPEERRFRTRDGDEIVTLLQASPRRNLRGDVVGTHTLYVDVTETRRAQELLGRIEAMETAIDGMAILDESGTYVYANQAHAEIYGYEGPDSLLGNSWRMLYADEEADRLEREALSALKTEGEWRGEATGLRTDGTTFPQELSLSRLEDGGYICVVRDLTDVRAQLRTIRELQRRSQELIRERDRERIAERAVEIARETLGLPLTGVHLVDEEYERLEPIAVTAEVREHLDRVPVYSRTEPTRSVDERNWQIFESGEPNVIEDVADDPGIDKSETPTRSGIIYPLGDHGLLITTSDEPNAFGTIERELTELLATLLTAVLDRTEREVTLEEQKRRLQRETDRLDEFASVVSHDLRNPLNVAHGRVRLAREACDSEHLESVERALDRMDTLVDDLLTLARDGKRVGETEPIALESIVGDCWRTVETADATLEIDTDRVIEADRSRLQQLLENLVRNAIEHGGGGVGVTVGPLEDGFFIEDDGPGIPAADRAHVFDAGYSSTTDGTGFGLSIVEGIAEAHGWQIAVTESGTGGARFEITGVDVIE